MRLYRKFTTIAALTCVVTIVGCGGGSSNPTTYPMSGTVTQNGAPVEGAVVSLVDVTVASDPNASGHSAVGVTDGSGKYTLTTFENSDGAVPGQYKVRVFKYKSDGTQQVDAQPATGGGESVDFGDDYVPPDEAAPQSTPPPQHLLPAKYASVSATPLEYTVTEGANVFDIELDSN